MAFEINNKTAIAFMIAFLLLAMYLAYDKGSEKLQEFKTAQQQQGQADATIAIYNVVANCQQLPLTFNNQTVNLVAIECLQQG
ncbi:hypothetical protein LCGC14_3160660 [marine sediment metagenome]|uniref:Uncharacterized protein n=1 Tax=marine sediment metagenome TaxID=412755 RepID=A0A0F8YFV7_9ZZZZ